VSKEERRLHLVPRTPEQDALAQHQSEGKTREDNDGDDDEYSDLDQLERLESIREDMEEFGLTTLDEVIERIAVLNQKLDNQ
jgi:hypothetical protein